MRKCARARSSLLAALIRARALSSAKPYCFQRNYYSYYYFYYYSYTSLTSNNSDKHARKLTKICRRVSSGENRRFYWSRKKGGQKWLDSAPLKIKKSEPHNTDCRRTMKFGTHMYHDQMHQKLSWSHTLSPTGSRPFCTKFAILTLILPFPALILRRTPPRDLTSATSNSVSMIYRPGRWKVTKTVSFRHCPGGVVGRRISILRHENWNGHNSGIHDSKRPKPFVLEKSPALNRSMCQYWIWVIAPPTGDRKLHVLHFDALWVALWLDPPQIYSE